MKTYKVVVAFGDGKPLETTIEAKNGLEAQDVGFRNHPGARQIRIVGVIAEEKPELPLQQEVPVHPLFGAPEQEYIKPQSKTNFGCHPHKDRLLEEAVKLRKLGLSYSKIASQLDVGKTTVRTWLAGAELPVTASGPIDTMFY